MTTLNDLRRCSPGELEQVYARPGPVELPRGVFRGRHLAWIQPTVSQRPLLRAALTPGFSWLPYGVDFVHRCWFFGGAALRVGRFDASVGASRWRETDTVRLEYHTSRLPGLVRGQLYDEVKPLTADLCLGLGGVNADALGDVFFFSLERMVR